MKRIVSVTLVTLTLIFSSLFSNPSSAAPDLTKFAWPPEYSGGTGNSGKFLGYYFSLVDDFAQNNTGESQSFIRTTSTQRLCTDFNDSLCKKDIELGGNWWINQVLPPCPVKNALINCVEAVNIIGPDGTTEELIFDGTIPGNTWKEDLSIGLEAGSSSSKWVRKNETNPGKGYKVTVAGNLGISLSGKSTVTNATLVSYQTSIEPYEEISGAYKPGQIYVGQDGFRSYSSNTPNYCLWVDFNKCGVQSDFPKDTKFQLVIHVPAGMNGWLLGRLDQPTFEGKEIGLSISSKRPLNRVSITGYPVEIPLFSTKVEAADASEELVNDFQQNSFCKANPTQCLGYFGGNIASSYFDVTYQRFKMFEKYLNERANIVYPRWSVRTLQSMDRQYLNCRAGITGAIQGITTTNASIFQGAPPTFDGEEFLYKVAGVHLLPDNSIFKGSYDLVLNSEFARCLYKFNKAPIKATVQVTNADGTTNISTSTFNEKNGWVYISIKGFTFSQPTIKLKLSQESAAGDKPTATTPSTKPKTNSSITCVKGKIVKKVTALTPKCPAGYKKK